MFYAKQNNNVRTSNHKKLVIRQLVNEKCNNLYIFLREMLATHFLTHIFQHTSLIG